MALTWGWWQQEPGQEAAAQLRGFGMPGRAHLEEGEVEGGTLRGMQGQAVGPELWGIGWDMGKRKVWQERRAAAAGLIQRVFGHSGVWGSLAVQGSPGKERGKADLHQDHQRVQL